ncbi:APC family permease [Mycoplasma seminis]|uniref:APC family permease n=1 Tax=Mycoplasma seminis TaxID=512749 RepID=A0ABY9HAV7_9MOLU|nr:APC family permease [Mycoplasma seminis]WLP85320.1 APC family permease [Mycoplasma seminis]
MQKQFTERSFTFFTINFVIGVGFITTISTVLQISYWGYLVLILAAFCVFGITLVYSRLANTYNDHYGGSYSFARHLDDDVARGHSKRSKKRGLDNLIFFVGWNQFIQTPLLAAVAPLFLADAVQIALPDRSVFPQYDLVLWITRGVSIALFIAIIAISTIGLKTNKKIILFASGFKWFILLLAIGIMVFAVAKEPQLPMLEISSDTKMNHIQPKLIISNTLLFMYAFAGIEDVSSMVKDVKFKSFRKILLISFAFIFIFYLVFFTLYLFLPASLKPTATTKVNISAIYTYGLGAWGVGIFIVGFLCNDLSFKLFQSASTARRVVPLAEDGYLPAKYAVRNKNHEFKNAIWFTTVITLIAMVILWIIPTLSNEQKQADFFDATIIACSTALFIEDIITFFLGFALARKKRIPKIPLWEKLIYIITILAIGFVLLLFYVPWIIGDSWGYKNTVSLVVYIAFVLLGYVMKFWYQHGLGNKLRKLLHLKPKKEIQIPQDNQIDNDWLINVDQM